MHPGHSCFSNYYQRAAALISRPVKQRDRFWNNGYKKPQHVAIRRSASYNISSSSSSSSRPRSSSIFSSSRPRSSSITTTIDDVQSINERREETPIMALDNSNEISSKQPLTEIQMAGESEPRREGEISSGNLDTLDGDVDFGVSTDGDVDFGVSTVTRVVDRDGDYIVNSPCHYSGEFASEQELPPPPEGFHQCFIPVSVKPTIDGGAELIVDREFVTNNPSAFVIETVDNGDHGQVLSTSKPQSNNLRQNGYTRFVSVNGTKVIRPFIYEKEVSNARLDERRDRIDPQMVRESCSRCLPFRDVVHSRMLKRGCKRKTETKSMTDGAPMKKPFTCLQSVPLQHRQINLSQTDKKTWEKVLDLLGAPVKELGAPVNDQNSSAKIQIREEKISTQLPTGFTMIKSVALKESEKKTVGLISSPESETCARVRAFLSKEVRHRVKKTATKRNRKQKIFASDSPQLEDLRLRLLAEQSELSDPYSKEARLLREALIESTVSSVLNQSMPAAYQRMRSKVMASIPVAAARCRPLDSRYICARVRPFIYRKPVNPFAFLVHAARIRCFSPVKRRTPAADYGTRSAEGRRPNTDRMSLEVQYGRYLLNCRPSLTLFSSPIHGIGVMTLEAIMQGQLIVEYVGCIIRSVLADRRETLYDKKGLGHYMFRVDDEFTIDATCHGNVARFINHCCTPNCDARVISYEEQKRIVIFAKRDIEAMEEISYDYKLPYEKNSRIPCRCTAIGCKKYLN